MKDYRFVLILVCISAILVSCSGPGKKEKPPHVPQTTFLSAIYDTKPFNINTERLSPLYAGHNPELLYNNIRLRHEIVKRRPDETVEQHRSRIAGEIYAPIIGSCDFDSVYAFRITPKKISYDAAKNAVRLDVTFTPVFEKGSAASKRAFVVRYQPQLDNTYVIKENNKSQRVIEEKKFSEYAIMPFVNRGVPAENAETITATVAMTPQDAKKSQADLMLLLIGRLISPYITYEEINRNPVPGASGVYLARYHYLHVQVVDMWVYDVTDGKILQKFSQVSGFRLQARDK